jgi:hypothetical protein
MILCNLSLTNRFVCVCVCVCVCACGITGEKIASQSDTTLYLKRDNVNLSACFVLIIYTWRTNRQRGNDTAPLHLIAEMKIVVQWASNQVVLLVRETSKARRQKRKNKEWGGGRGGAVRHYRQASAEEKPKNSYKCQDSQAVPTCPSGKGKMGESEVSEILESGLYF